MAGWIELDTIAPGTPVFAADETPLGQVEAIEQQMVRVSGRLIPGVAVARADPAGIYLYPESDWDRVGIGSGGAAPVAGDSPVGDESLPIIAGTAADGTIETPTRDRSTTE